MKIDFRNAFNSIRRDKILSLVKNKIPKIYNFVNQCYAEKSSLRFGSEIIDSEEGVQQGDPLGPFLFSLGIQDLVSSCKSEFNVWYLDDGTLAGDFETVIADATMITNSLATHGLEVNPSKSELFLVNPKSDLCKNAPESFNSIMPGIKICNKTDLKLLGAPIYVSAVESVLKPKLENLQLMMDRLKEIESHEALFLVRHVYGIPKLTYFLRTAPCFMKSEFLQRFDEIIKKSLISILNINLSERAYIQATLPIAYGGLGIRLATDIALVGFLSSVCATTAAVQNVLPPNFSHTYYSNELWDSAFKLWCQQSPQKSAPELKIYQSEWDKVIYEYKYDTLLNSSHSVEEKARLLAVASKSASDWLHSIPIPSLGLKLDSMTLKISCGLRLGSTLCHPYKCICGEDVEAKGLHGLSCGLQMGRNSRHSQINDLIKRALVQAKIPAVLEPSNLSTSDGKRPDGLTLSTWKNGKCLIWDATVTNCLCKSSVLLFCSKKAGAAAE